MLQDISDVCGEPFLGTFTRLQICVSCLKQSHIFKILRLARPRCVVSRLLMSYVLTRLVEKISLETKELFLTPINEWCLR